MQSSGKSDRTAQTAKLKAQADRRKRDELKRQEARKTAQGSRLRGREVAGPGMVVCLAAMSGFYLWSTSMITAQYYQGFGSAPA